MPTKLSPRQESFCRHYAVSGNAAEAARAAGYSETCARQQGYQNLHTPYIMFRVDEIQRGFAETAGREAAILLSRLEQVWPVAAKAGNVHGMLMTLGMQAKLAGLFGGRDNRIRLWGPDGQAGPLERALERAGDGAALAAAEAAVPRDAAQQDRRLASPAARFEQDPEPEEEDVGFGLPPDYWQWVRERYPVDAGDDSGGGPGGDDCYRGEGHGDDDGMDNALWHGVPVPGAPDEPGREGDDAAAQAPNLPAPHLPTRLMELRQEELLAARAVGAFAAAAAGERASSGPDLTKHDIPEGVAA